jgi:hypothetical protein
VTEGWLGPHDVFVPHMKKLNQTLNQIQDSDATVVRAPLLSSQKSRSNRRQSKDNFLLGN